MNTLLLSLVISLLCGGAGFWLRQKTKLTVVEVSALLTLTAGLVLPRLFSEGNLFAITCTAVSYATMCNEKRAGRYLDILPISAVCALVIYFGQTILVGVGGRLGTSAAVSVLLFVVAKNFFSPGSVKSVAKS